MADSDRCQGKSHVGETQEFHCMSYFQLISWCLKIWSNIVFCVRYITSKCQVLNFHQQGLTITTNCQELQEIAFVSSHASHMLGLSYTIARGKEQQSAV